MTKTAPMCSFEDATRREICMHYRKGRQARECWGYLTEATKVSTHTGTTIVFHCAYDPYGAVVKPGGP